MLESSCNIGFGYIEIKIYDLHYRKNSIKFVIAKTEKTNNKL